MQRILTVLLICLAGNLAFSEDRWGYLREDIPAADKLYTATALRHPDSMFPEEYVWDKQKGSWTFRENNALKLFTYIDPAITDIRIENEAVCFRMESPAVKLAIGNYQNKQSLGERKSLPFKGAVIIDSLEVKGIKVYPLIEGKIAANGFNISNDMALSKWQGKTVWKGGWWCSRGLEGLLFELSGEKGSEVKIRKIAVTHEVYGGYFRKEFNLPEGKIFKAVLNAGQVDYIEINGRKVEGFTNPCLYNWPMYWTKAVDIKNYLQAGKNCIGLYSWREDYRSAANPFIYAQGSIILDSGEKIDLQTDTAWKTSQSYQDKWSTPGFNDRGWAFALSAGNLKGYSIGRMPADTGFMIIENPYEEKLFYSQDKEIKFKIKIPQGFKKDNPLVSYNVNTAEEGKLIVQAEQSVFVSDELSLVYAVNLGRLPQGVYTLSCKVMAEAQVIETLNEEPFIVAGRVSQIELEAEQIEAGMGLELVDTIDCVDPKDTHLFLEGGYGKSQVIAGNGLIYRELGGGCMERDKITSFLMYKVKIARVDEPHLFVLEYPDDKERWIEFSLLLPPSDSTLAESLRKNPLAFGGESSGAITGGRFPLSGRMKQLSLPFFPEQENLYAVVNTAALDKPAAVSKIKIYRINSLPALKVVNRGERYFGVYTERGFSFRNLVGCRGRVRSVDNMVDWQRVWGPGHFALWFKAAERYIRYMRFCGENLYVLGCYQYNECNTPYSREYVGKTSRLEPDYREVLVRLMAENNIVVLAGIEYARSTRLWFEGEGMPSNIEVCQGKDTYYCVSNNGNQISPINNWDLLGPGSAHFNVFHPAVQEDILRVVAEICEKFYHYPNFKGIYNVDIPGRWGATLTFSQAGQHKSNFLDALNWGYEDISIDLFEKDTGVSLPVSKSDPRRFKKRYDWIMANARESWIGWRCKKIYELRRLILERIRHYRRDLKLVSAYHLSPDAADELEKNKMDFHSYLKLDGQDLSLYRSDANMVIGRYGFVFGFKGYDEYFKGLRTLEYPPIIKGFANMDTRLVCLKNIFHENPIINKFSFDWPWERLLIVGPPYPGGEYAGWPFSRVLADSDPEMIVLGWCDDNIIPGHEEAIRNFIRGYIVLPREKFEDIRANDIDSRVLVRRYTQNEITYFYLLNLSESSLEVMLELASRKALIELSTGRSVSDERVKLRPYGLLGFKVNEGKAEISSVKVLKEGIDN